MLDWDIRKQKAGDNSVQVAGNDNLVDRSTTHILDVQITQFNNYHNSERDDLGSDLIGLNEFFSLKRPYVSDISFPATSLTDGTFWTDEGLEERIEQILLQKGICIINGAEGRGKSVLTISAAYRKFYKKGYYILVTRRNWSLDRVCSLIEALVKSESKILIILENIHVYSPNLNDLLDRLELILGVSAKVTKRRNLLFFLYKRPTYEDDYYLTAKPERVPYYINLPRYQVVRSQRIAKFWAEKYKLNYRNLKINGRRLCASPHPNLKDLYRYFEVFRRPDNVLLSVTDADVIAYLKEKYGIYSLTDSEKNCLSLLSSLGYFEAPVDSAFLTEEEKTVLTNFFRLGLCYQMQNKFYLAHSTDAETLSHALWYDPKRRVSIDEAFVEDVSKDIIVYFKKILAASIPHEKLQDDLEMDFVSPVLFSIEKKPSFRELRRHFTQVETAKIIVSEISFRYLLIALIPRRKVRRDKRFFIYQESKALLKEDLINLDFQFLIKLNCILEREYKYSGLFQDMFGECGHSLLNDYFEKWALSIYENRETLWKAIGDMGADMSKCLGERLSILEEDYKNSLIFAVTYDASRRSAQVVKDFLSGNLSFEKAHDMLEGMVKAVRMRLISAPIRDSSLDLYVFLKNVSVVDYELHERLVRDDVFLKAMRKRLRKTNYNPNDMYLFSICYSRDYVFKARFDKKLGNATLEQRQSMGRWLYRIQSIDGVEFGTSTLPETVREFLKIPPRPVTIEDQLVFSDKQ